MPTQARYIYHYCMRYLGNEPALIPTWNFHHTLPLNRLFNPTLPNRAGRTHRVLHRPFKATVRRIADLGPRMNHLERRILNRILTFMQSPSEAMRDIGFRNPVTLPAIVERCSREVSYYARLINRALAHTNENQQQEAQRELINYIEIEEDIPEENQWQREAINRQQEEEKQQQDNLSTLGSEVRTETNPLQGRDTNTQQQEEEQNTYMTTLVSFHTQQLEEEEEGQFLSPLVGLQNQNTENPFLEDAVAQEYGPPNFWDEEVEELREGFKTLGSSIQDWYKPYLCYKKETF